MANLSNINNKFLVTTTGEVLVGRTAATGTSKLQVSGSLLIGTDINSGIPLVVQETTAAGFAIGFMRNTNATNGNGLVIDVNSTGGAYIQDWRQASNVKMRLLQNGNLGIGTTNIGTQSNLYLGASSSSEGGQLTLQKATGGTLAAHIDAYTTGGNDYMRILSGGDTSTTAAPFVFDLTNVRVGIGTSSPDYKLDVRADTGSIGQIFVKGGNNPVTSNGEINSEILFGSNDGSVQSGNVGGKISSVTEATNGALTGLAFYTYTQTSPGLDEKMRIRYNGNVGIGVTSPSQKLQVDGGATGFNQGIPATSGTTQNGMLRLTSGSSVYGETFDFGMNVAPTYAWIQATNKGSLAINYNLALNPNGGNVGIGTAGPSKKLEVAGSYKLGTNAWIQYDAVYPYTISMLNGAGIGNLILNAGYGSSGYESKIELQGSNTTGAAGITLSTGSTTKMQITVNGSTILYPSAGSKGLSMNDTNQVMNSGYINGNQAISLTFTCTTMSSMFIECVFNHYGYITSYGCSRVATFAVGPVIQINNIQEITTGNGGSWTFNRVSNGEFTVVKTAGTYGGGGRWYVKINGANVYAS